jgi:extracellular factor (EF) 3-hydroxypalmitic acid methyl ester biosynthesis protein
VRIRAFQFLTEGDVELLLEGARHEKFQRGAELFQEGQMQINLYVIRKGLVRVDRRYQGEPLSVARYGIGEVLGEIAFLEQAPHFGTAVAEEEVEVEILQGQRLQALLASDSGLASRFFHSLACCLGERLRQILPGILTADSPSQLRRLPRVGQVSESQLPPELTAGVAEFRSSLLGIAARVAQRQLPLAAAQLQVSSHCDSLVTLLDRSTQEEALTSIGMEDLLAFREMADIARGVGGFVFRETFSLFMQSASIAQGFDRARNPSEDREMLERIARNDAEGQGVLGPLIDRWFLDRPFCQAQRQVRPRMAALLRETAAEALAPPVRITGLRVGTAQEVFALLAHSPLDLYVTCIGNDASTLLASAAHARQQGCADRITFLQADLGRLLHGQEHVALGGQQIIYGLGVCEHLGDADIRALLQWAHGLLSPGGFLLLSNFDLPSSDRAFLEHILDWSVTFRSRAAFRSLLADTPFQLLEVESSTPTGPLDFLKCRRL